jgi:hypothetical protein
MSEDIPETTGDEPARTASPAVSMNMTTIFGILDNWLVENNLYTDTQIHWRVMWDRNGFPVTICGFDDGNIDLLEGE